MAYTNVANCNGNECAFGRFIIQINNHFSRVDFVPITPISKLNENAS